MSLVFSLFAAVSAQAQTSPSSTTLGSRIIYSGGIETGLSTGSFNDTHKANLGGSIQAAYQIDQSTYLTLSAGYTDFFGKDKVFNSSQSAADLHYLPVKLGLKYFPLLGFYVQGEAGAAFILNKSDLGYDRAADFVYSPQIGVQFPVSDKSFIDLGLRYEGTTKYKDDADYSKVNFFGLRVAYAFGL